MRKATPRYVSLLVKTSFKRGSYIKAGIGTVDNLKLILLDCDVIKWHYIVFFFLVYLLLLMLRVLQYFLITQKKLSSLRLLIVTKEN